MKTPKLIGRVAALALLLLLIGHASKEVKAQGVAGGTVISNRISITYTEPTGSTVQTVSNTVTVTVVNVTGLAITPDNGTTPGVNGGAANVQRTFVLSNTGNISETISFGASGASLIKTGPFTVTSAFVDVDNSGAFNTGDIDILAASPGSLTMAFQTSVNVIVRGDVSTTAAEGATITLQLGDASANSPTFDNVPADLTAGSVKTVGSTGTNGNLEARGDLRFVVLATGNILIGPAGQPAAVGPTNTNDDYTNKTQTAGVNVPFGSNTTAGAVITFVNTIRNGSATADSVVITAPTIPTGTGWVVEVRTGANPFVNITAGSTTISVPGSSDLNIDVRITSPSGIAVLTGYSTVLRATSGITPANFNETIDRLWTGFVRADKSYTVTNSTGVGAAGAAVPGAVIQYSIAYSNVTATSGTGNVNLVATNVVMTEDGNAAPNNWGTTTTHVAGSASDTTAGSSIAGDTAGSSVLTLTIPSLAPGATGTFKFSRTIK
jgi:hypothetical protein